MAVALPSLIAAIHLLTSMDAHSVKPPRSKVANERFVCSPSQLTFNDVLTINFGSRRGSELLVMNPDKDPFFIAQRRLPGASRSDGMPSEMLLGIVEMQISLKTFSARKWHTDATNVELVFRKPGRYQILFGDELESDVIGATQSCELTVVD